MLEEKTYILGNQSVSELDLPTFSNREGSKKKVVKKNIRILPFSYSTYPYGFLALHVCCV